MDLKQNEFNYFVYEEYPQYVEKVAKALDSTVENTGKLNKVC